MNLKSLLDRLSAFGRKPERSLTYVWVVVRLPLTEDDVRGVAQHWIANDAQGVLANPAARDAMKADLHMTDEDLKSFVDMCEFQVFRHFPLIGMVADPASVAVLRVLPFVRYAHSVPDEYSLFYLHLIKGLHWAIDDDPGTRVVNLSLQPLDPYPYQPLEAVNVATQVVAERGKTVVFAAGNFGPSDGSMNPWSLAPWVISVGAADTAGTKLWAGSSRGVPRDPDNHPTIVAPGSRTGTSFAAAHISGVCATIYEVITEGLAKSTTLDEWRTLASQQFDLDVTPIEPEPATVKRILIDMARPMPAYGVHEVGAGFVSIDIAQEYYRNFRLSNFLKVFGKKRTAAP